MPRMQVNGTELFYVDEGAGKPLVFIHGIGAGHHMFESQIETFKKNYRVICPDLRGNGGSGRLNGPIRTVLDRQYADIKTLLDQLGIEKAVFCGVSYGGAFTLHYALKDPQRLAGMVIVDSFSDTKMVGAAEVLIMFIQFVFGWAIYMPMAWLVALQRRQYRRWATAQAYVVNLTRRIRKYELVLQRSAVNQINLTPLITRINCPALGIVGGTRKVAIRYMKRAMDALPNAELEIIPDSIDPTNLCQKEKFDKSLQVFLEKIKW